MTSTPARADGPEVYQPQVVPACKVHKTPEGEVCGYLDIEDWKRVLVVDAEVVSARIQLKNELAKLAAMTTQLTELHGQVDIYASSQALLVQRNSALTTQLLALDWKYQQERVKPRWGSPVAWTLAAVTTSILAGVVIADLLN